MSINAIKINSKMDPRLKHSGMTLIEGGIIAQDSLNANVNYILDLHTSGKCAG